VNRTPSRRFRQLALEEEDSQSPSRPVALPQQLPTYMTSGGQRAASIKHSDVIETKETSREDVTAIYVLSVHPPSEVDDELQEAFSEPCAVTSLSRVP